MKDYYEALFHTKRRFVIIGLTGYTGSGCTTVANFLGSDKKIHIPEFSGICNLDEQYNDERRYNKLYRVWNNANMVWSKFIKIFN